ncbi:hypothetical protein FSP39_023469 [Pinctada imbricata]|uniref:ABC transporter domain-containing protein n=1 Tax=Pinctada imbricata TaxID=66713 RepID=A0AA89BY48_PINIB|nr:hypothetical protein FSP39_023469 [Pinctada imbricata]
MRVTGTQVPDGRIWPDCSDIYIIPGGLPKMVAYAPQTKLTKSVMEKTLKFADLKSVKGFPTEEEMVSFLLFANSTYNNTHRFLGGVAFTSGSSYTDNSTDLPLDIEYKIRLNSRPRKGRSSKSLNPLKKDTQWFTQFMFPLYQVIGPRYNSTPCSGVPGYQKEGFLSLQNSINKAIFHAAVEGNNTEGKARLESLTDFTLRRHPFPPYNDDKFVLVLQQQFPLVLILSFVLVALSIVKDVVHEKERKLKESMKMMGLNGWLHWSAWFTKYLLFLLITVALLTIFLTIPTPQGKVIGKTNPFIVFLFLLLYSIATISFCFTVSVFFSKANSGAAAGGILFFCSYIPYLFLEPRYAELSMTQKLASCLVSNIAMSYGGLIIGMFEGTGNGIQFSTLNQGASVDDNLSMAHIMVMLVVDTVLYFIVTWYIEAVFPGDYGVPQRWYFPLTKSYWCGTSVIEVVPDDKRICIGQNPAYFEDDPIGLKAGIQIRNLSKTFGRKENRKVAVAGMSIDMYEGQITALLGHNGAGKTTTMSMLTGFLPPSGGTANVNGYDIREDIASVRSSLGLCPQHDILFDSLTVEEHLRFFGKLKGCTSENIDREVEEMLQAIRLENKRNAQSHTLSGGMKRKLSVGIALIAGSKIVILDEPSSGLDPDARRQIWTVLQQSREGRTMLLTTHFMEEADLLGDRIAIMADRVVKCCGSSLFLKNKYGAGYHLTIVKENNCNVDKVTSVVQKYVHEAELESNIGYELSYILPRESSAQFEPLFDDLQNNRQTYGISSLGASVTTMEEVFLRVGESSDQMMREKLQNKHRPSDGVALDLNINNGPVLPENGLDINDAVEYSENIGLFMEQFYAMFVKRALHTFRNKLISLTQLIIPLFFTVMALIVVKTFPGPSDSPALKLTTSGFGDNFITYSEKGSNLSNLSMELRSLGNFYAAQFTIDSEKALFVNNQSGFQNNPDLQNFLFNKGKQGIGEYDLHYLVGAEFDYNSTTKKMKSKAFFNNQAYHSSPISMAALANGVFKYLTNNSRYTLTAINHPLPRTDKQKIEDETEGSTTGFTISFNFIFGMSFLSSSFVLFLIKERVTKAKHIQFVSGVHSFNFWFSTFCWDMINFMIPCAVLLFVFWAFDIKAYIIEDHVGHLILLFLLFGWAMLPFMYLLSFLFTVPSSGFVWITMFNILAGCATVLAVGILGIPQLGLKDLSVALEWVFLTFLPNYCLGQGLMDYYSNWEFLEACSAFRSIVKDKAKEACSLIPNPCCGPYSDNCGEYGCIYYNPDFLGWQKNGIGRMLAFLAAQGVMYFALLLFIESNIAQKILNMLKNRGSDYEKGNEDEIGETTPFVGIPQGECFGLLGINGAGKTTTFKMLTGDEIMTAGEAYLDEHSIRDNITQVRQRLGYCPQYDALIDQMTGRETLFMFARLRGVNHRYIPDMVENLLSALLLQEHADKLVKAYSMEECEALCTRLAIMVNGEFRCLGSTQHLKNKFGEGYTLIAKICYPSSGQPPDMEPIMKFISEQFPYSELKDLHQGMVIYHIKDTTLSWARIFGLMEKAKDEFNIEDYLISQTTLEQVFINFARAQIPPTEVKNGCCKGCFSMCCGCGKDE